MARWLIRLPLALLLALAVHGIALWVVAQEMQALASVIQRKADPLFTRQITQPVTQAASPQALPAPVELKKQPVVRVNRTQAAINNEAKKPADIALPEPIPDIPTPAVTESLASLTTSTVQEPSPTLALVTETLPAITTETTTLASVPGSGTTGLTTDTLVMQGNWPIDTRLTYDLGGYFRGDLHGDATVQWTRDPATQGEGYQVRIELNSLISAVLTSQGKVRAEGLLPRAYEEQFFRKARSVTLDDTAVVLTDGTRIPRPQRVGDGPDESATVQDAASQFVELGHRFANGRAKLAEGEIVRVWLARPGGLDAWVYDVGPAETLYLPHIGPVQAFHLKPRPQVKPRGSTVAEMWFAPSLQYLPVRIKIMRGEEGHLDLKVKKIEQR
jgi:Protein of unknown function (DUF3108)